MRSTETIVLEYGSLMSGYGLQSRGPLRAASAGRVAFSNGERGLGRLANAGDHFAMVLDRVRDDVPLGARLLAADAAPTGEAEGLAIGVAPMALARFADHAGYSGGALQRLREEATAEGTALADYLWAAFERAGLDVRDFRTGLYRRIGYTSPHAVPHPIRLSDGRCVLTFLAPGFEGTGSDRIVAVRVRSGQTGLLSPTDAWRRQPSRAQLAYLVSCLLGGVHGIAVRDLLASLADDPGLAGAVRGAIVTEQRQELARFLAATNLPASTYFSAFGPASHALDRSGLDGFLRGCMGSADQ